jgi:cellulose synthase operon protein YhjQ
MRPGRYLHRDARQVLPPTGVADDGPAEDEDGGIIADPMTAAFGAAEPARSSDRVQENMAAKQNAAAESAQASVHGGGQHSASVSAPAKAEPISHEQQIVRPVAADAPKPESRPAVGNRSVTPMPAWLEQEKPKRVVEPAPESAVEDTLQHQRERVATRWFALRELFEQGPADHTPEPQRSASGEVPVLAVFSLAGGVGKTSMVATLGRALSSSGEKVLLTDTTSHGLLPFYFGASELRPGVVRTFSPPVGSADAPIHLLSLEAGRDLLEKGGDLEAQEWLSEELAKNGQGMQRILVDMSPSVPWVLRRVARMHSIVLVPMKPDMSSVITLNVVERFFADVTDTNGRPVHPRYLLNGFDASQPLHLDVREVLRQQLGDRLLPFVIRRSPAVSEALAEGMTVMDYAPEAPVAGDFLNLASWLRTQAAPAVGFRKARWSEQ